MPGLVNPGGATGSTPTAPAEHISTLKDVVREMNQLDGGTPVLVQQLACAEPGCPPVETVVAALGPPRRTWKFPKPTADVSPQELRTAMIHHPEGSTHADHD